MFVLCKIVIYVIMRLSFCRDVMEFMGITGFEYLKPMDEYDLEERDELVSYSCSGVYGLDYESSWHVVDHDDIRVMVLERDEAD